MGFYWYLWELESVMAISILAIIVLAISFLSPSPSVTICIGTNILLVPIEFYWYLYWILLVHFGFYWYLLDSIGTYWILLVPNGFYGTQ